MKYLFTFILLLFASQTAFSFQLSDTESPLWRTLSPGPYDVGFKVEFLLDDSRIMESTDSLPHALNGRPIRVKLYYPGEKRISDTPLLFLEQIDIIPANLQFAIYNTILSIRDHRLQGQFSPASDSLERILFHTQTKAHYDIPFAEGKFPLLIYELGLDDHQMENSVMWEYLASHGYVVAVIPCFGETLDSQYVGYTAEGANLLSLDAEYAIDSLINEPHVNKDLIGAIGHSFGGIVVHNIASKNDLVKAVATLDGSINTFMHRENTSEILSELRINASTVTIPVLNIYTKAQGERDLSYIKSLRSPVYNYSFDKASHYDFQNFPLYASITDTDDRRVTRLRSSIEGEEIYLASVQLVKAFFDHYFYGSEKGLNFIQGTSTEAGYLHEIGSFE